MAYIPGYSPPASWMGPPLEDAPVVQQLLSIPPGYTVRIPDADDEPTVVLVHEVISDTEQVTVRGYIQSRGDRFTITRSRPHGVVLKEN